MLQTFPRLTVIAAHFGGYTLWDEATRRLAGRFENLWVDCSSSFYAMSDAHARTLIAAYGADRVLFGTDYPMWNPARELERFLGLGLDVASREKILWDNAAGLFGLPEEKGDA